MNPDGPDGGYAAMTKLIIENLGFPSAVADRPVALLGVDGMKGCGARTVGTGG